MAGDVIVGRRTEHNTTNLLLTREVKPEGAKNCVIGKKQTRVRRECDCDNIFTRGFGFWGLGYMKVRRRTTETLTFSCEE